MAGAGQNITVKANGLAIRDDGMLFPATPGVLRLPQYRPYHGNPKATLEQRLEYLRGQFAGAADSRRMAMEQGAFDIGTADKLGLAEFASMEYGVDLDLRKDIGILRAEVAALASNAETQADDGATDAINGPAAGAAAAPKPAAAEKPAGKGGVRVPRFAEQS